MHAKTSYIYGDEEGQSCLSTSKFVAATIGGEVLFIMGSGGEEPDEEEQQYNNPRNSAAIDKMKAKLLSENQEAKAKPDVGNNGDAPPSH